MSHQSGGRNNPSMSSAGGASPSPVGGNARSSHNSSPAGTQSWDIERSSSTSSLRQTPPPFTPTLTQGNATERLDNGPASGSQPHSRMDVTPASAVRSVHQAPPTPQHFLGSQTESDDDSRSIGEQEAEFFRSLSHPRLPSHEVSVFGPTVGDAHAQQYEQVPRIIYATETQDPTETPRRSSSNFQPASHSSPAQMLPPHYAPGYHDYSYSQASMVPETQHQFNGFPPHVQLPQLPNPYGFPPGSAPLLGSQTSPTGTARHPYNLTAMSSQTSYTGPTGSQGHPFVVPSVPSSQVSARSQASTVDVQQAPSKGQGKRKEKAAEDGPKATSNRGKKKQGPVLSSEDAYPPTKRARKQAPLTHSDVESASIRPLSSRPIPSAQAAPIAPNPNSSAPDLPVELDEEADEGGSNHRFSEEEKRAYADFFYNPENYEWNKANQPAAFRNAKETVFGGKVDVDKIRNLNTRMLYTYKIYEEIMDISGTGRPDDVEIAARLNKQGYTISVPTLIRFGESYIYRRMRQVLVRDPTVAKEVDLHPGRPLSPDGATVGDVSRFGADVIDISDDSTQPQATGSRPARKRRGGKGKAKEDDEPESSYNESTAQISSTLKGLQETSVLQRQLLVAKHASHTQSLELSREEANNRQREQEREDSKLSMAKAEAEQEKLRHAATQARQERERRLHETKVIDEWSRSDSESLRAQALAVQQAHDLLPLDTLVHVSLFALHHLVPHLVPLPDSVRSRMLLAPDSAEQAQALANEPVLSSDEPRNLSVALPDPTPSPVDQASLLGPVPNEGEAGPGPATMNNLIKKITDLESDTSDD